MVIGDELSNLTENNNKALVKKTTKNYELQQNNDNGNGCFALSSLLGSFFLFVHKFLAFLRAAREQVSSMLLRPCPSGFSDYPH